MTKRKLNTNEEAFLLSTFSEFVKLWRSRKNSRLFVESVNGSAFINFSAFVGYSKNVRRTQSSQSQRKPKKKSSRKIQRDNDRAANFQERKRQEEAAATAARVTSSSPITITSSASSAPLNFSFASPAVVSRNLKTAVPGSVFIAGITQQCRTCRGKIQRGSHRSK